MAKKRKINIWRFVWQWGIMGILLFLGVKIALVPSYSPDFEAYCPFGGIQALSSYLVNNSLACTMTSAQIVMGGMLFIGIVLFSKLFCAYICPIGTVVESLGKIGERLKVRFTPTGIIDKLLRSFKYVLLFIVFYYTVGSSELFCKKFDPYYAIASGFDTDVDLTYAIISLISVFVGSIFIRQFWCRYLCPLGAISNIFKFLIMFVVAMGLYVMLLSFGVDITYVWPLAVICSLGYLLEIFKLKAPIFPITKITRNVSSCTSCQKCNFACPQAIDVANCKVVKHVDCTLCGECVAVCPENETLTVGKKGKIWLPAVITLVLVAAGIYLGTTWEVPTIDEKWGTEEQMESAESFSRSGMKNIKCFGSAKAFSSKMRKVDGVLGVAAYVGTKTAKVYFDPQVIDKESLEKLLFTPMVSILSLPAESDTIVYISEVLIENFFDTYDASYLSKLLSKEEEVFAMQTEYGCPVKVLIYHGSKFVNDEKNIKSIIESESVTMVNGDSEKIIPLEFELIKLNDKVSEITLSEFRQRMFTSYSHSFNERNLTDDSQKVELYFPEGSSRSVSGKLPYIASHLSNDTGAVGVSTIMRNDSVFIQFSYTKDLTTEEDILEAVKSDSLTITYTSGRVSKVANMFDF